MLAEGAERSRTDVEQSVVSGFGESLKASTASHRMLSALAQADGDYERAFLALWAIDSFGDPEGRGQKLGEAADRRIGKWLRALDVSAMSNGTLLRILIDSAIHPDVASKWKEFATVQFRQGNRFLAAVCVWRLSQVAPPNGWVETFKARLFEAATLPVAAVAEWTRVLAFEHYQVASAKAIARLLSRTPSKVTRRAIDQIAARFPDSREIRLLAIASRSKLDKVPDGAEELVAASIEKPGEAWIWRARANIHRTEQKPDEAVKCLLTAADVTNPRARKELLDIASDLAAIGDTAAEQRVLAKAIYGQPRGPARDRVIAHLVERVSLEDRTAFSETVPRRRLLLISQIQRSGGTLLSQLLDGHPQVLTHPHEVQIGRPEKWHWPDLDLAADPKVWLTELIEPRLALFTLTGYEKGDGNAAATAKKFPFNLDLASLCKHFLRMFDNRTSVTQREIIDAYFGSYFAAWPDYAQTGAETWVSGFVPRLIANRGSTERLVRDYPDGLIVSCIRDPWGWYASARRHDPVYANIVTAAELWKSSTLSALYLHRTDPDHIHLMTYDALVSAPEGELRILAARLGIQFVPSMLDPTYLGNPMLPNSSFEVATRGIHLEFADRRSKLSQDQIQFLDRDLGNLYREVKAEIAASRGARAPEQQGASQ